jgi:hypothetical protein
VIFLSRPALAARLFGLPTEDRTGYVRALGVRDLALAAGLVAAASGSRRRLSSTCALAALIPAGDLILVGRSRGASAAGPMALHALSLVSLAAAALLARRPSFLLSRAGRDPGMTAVRDRAAQPENQEVAAA